MHVSWQEIAISKNIEHIIIYTDFNQETIIYNMTNIKKLQLLVITLFLVINSYAQKLTCERRVYYLDATYSMISPSKLWNPVRKDLANAINAIEDETTEIYVIAFGGNNGSELKVWNDYATDEGKSNVIKGFMGFNPKRNTMTYLDRPLKDFYSNRVESDRATYCFLMTDGKNETPNPNTFSDALKLWGDKYGNSNVYGFYVMLNNEAKDPVIESIIENQEHLWKVETADVNINLIRLQNKAVFNIRTDNTIQIPFESGKYDNLNISASFSKDSKFAVKNSFIKNGNLIVEVDVTGNKSLMPESSTETLFLSISNAGRFDFLITEKVSIKCNNKKEFVLQSPTSRQKWGKVSHYDDFWFVSGDIKPVHQKINFDFSEDATANKNTFAEFAFVDCKGNIINPQEMVIKVNGIELKENSFRITPNDKEIDIEIYFPKDVKNGKKQGFLRLTNHNLHRLNNNECTNQAADAFQWTIYNDKNVNPLKLALIWFFAIILASFLLWMIVLKRLFYPVFGTIQKTFNVPGMAPLIINFRGARIIEIAASHPKKQSLWNRFWTGKIIYKTHPAFITPITFKPSRGRRILARVMPNSYQVTPNPIPGVGPGKIIDIQKNLTININ